MCRYVSDLSSHASARARLHMLFITAMRPTAAEEFRTAAFLRSYTIQKHCRHRNCAFLQYLSSYITQALKVSADNCAYVLKSGASAMIFFWNWYLWYKTYKFVASSSGIKFIRSIVKIGRLFYELKMGGGGGATAQQTSTPGDFRNNRFFPVGRKVGYGHTTACAYHIVDGLQDICVSYQKQTRQCHTQHLFTFLFE
jgi:hypothetical protein